MKKLLLIVVGCLFCLNDINAQILRADELEEYAKENYGASWRDAAENLSQELVLDKNQALTFVQVIPAAGKSKNELYVLMNYWFTSSFNDANSVIKLNDKELGTIIAQGYVSDIAKNTGAVNQFNVSISPVIKCDIKDEKVRITYTISCYDVVAKRGGGWMTGNNPSVRSEEKWTLDSCYPFADRDSHKRTSCKALVMTYAYSNVILNKIEECIKNGLTGNEDDNW